MLLSELMPQYRLQTLLKLRTRVKDLAEQAFATAMKNLAAATQELQQLQADFERCQDERKRQFRSFAQGAMNKCVGAKGFLRLNEFEERLKYEEANLAREIEGQKIAVKRAEDDVEVKRQQMTAAARELEAVAKHKEKWTTQVRALRQAREELTQEDVNSALRMMRTRE
jgi:flagellar biosynthesis chaperone FliJ